MKRTNLTCPGRVSGMRLLCVSIIFGFGCNVALGQAVGSNEGGTVPQPVPEFPANNWWNTDISNAPVDPKSANYISFVNNGGTRHLHPDFGGNASYGGANATYGFPYVVVDGIAGAGKSPPPLQAVKFGYANQSDGVDHTTNTAFPFYPIPTEAITTPKWIECGNPGNVDNRNTCDRHLLVIDRDNKYLYELWNVWYDTAHTQWKAGSGAFFDMTKSARRPNGWTSADAAGLAVFPGLVRYDEAYNAYGTNVTDIDHAFRVTVRSTNSYVYPASHVAGHTSGALPMGARLRLKASVDISGYPAEMQKIFRAMKHYGLIVADNGSDMYISGTYDTNWDNNVLNPAFGALKASNFEVIQLGWKPPLNALTVTPNPVVGGFSTTGKVTLTTAAPTSGAAVALTAPAPLSVPANVTVPGGATTATFTIGTSAVGNLKNVVVTGTYSGSVQRTTVQVEPPPQLNSLTVNPNVIASAGTATGSVLLSENAPAGGIVVALASSNTLVAKVPAKVTVPAGSASASFNVTGKTVATMTTITISATYSGITKNATLTVNP